MRVPVERWQLYERVRSPVGPVLVKEELSHGHIISRKTIERGLSLLDLYFEETIVHLWRHLNEIYPDLSTDAYVDGPHIPREGAGHGAYTAAGEGGGSVQLLGQFMIAQLVDSGLPISVEVYRGNLNDSPQYADFVPQLMFMLKHGSMIVMDHGGSAKDLLHEIRDNGMDYLTRVRMNSSDMERIRRETGNAEYVGSGTMCIHHSFESSDRHTYLYFSVDRYIMGHLSAERRALRLMGMARDAKGYVEKQDPWKVVKPVKNPFFKVKSVKVGGDDSEPVAGGGCGQGHQGDGEGRLRMVQSEELEAAHAASGFRLVPSQGGDRGHDLIDQERRQHETAEGMERQHHTRSRAAGHNRPAVRFDSPLRHGSGPGRQED